MEFFNALFSAALDQNIVFGQLVGMVIVFLAAERPQDAFRLGGALYFFVRGASAGRGVAVLPYEDVAERVKILEEMLGD